MSEKHFCNVVCVDAQTRFDDFGTIFDWSLSFQNKKLVNLCLKSILFLQNLQQIDTVKLRTSDQFTSTVKMPKCWNFVDPVIRCTRYCIFVYNFPQNTETLAQVLFGPEFRGRDFDVSSE